MIRQTADGPGNDDSGLSTEDWLIQPPARLHTPRRPARGDACPRSAVPRRRSIRRSRRWLVSVVSRVSRAPQRSWRRAVIPAIGLVLMLAAVPATSAAGEITLTTPFPAIAVAPGSAPSFEISITTQEPGRVALNVGRVPDGWTAVLRGGGFTVDGVESDGSGATKVTLNVTVPADAAEGTQRIDVRGTIGGASTTLPVDIRVAPNAAGDVTLTSDIPQLKGASDATFPFSLTLTNDTPEDLPFSVVA